MCNITVPFDELLPGDRIPDPRQQTLPLYYSCQKPREPDEQDEWRFNPRPMITLVFERDGEKVELIPNAGNAMTVWRDDPNGLCYNKATHLPLDKRRK